MNFLCFSDDQYWRKFYLLTVSPNGVMIHFKYQVFHLTRRWRWGFAFDWMGRRAQYI